MALHYDNGKIKRCAYVAATMLIAIGCILSKEAGVAGIATPLGFTLLSLGRRDHSAARGHLIAASGTVTVAALLSFYALCTRH